MLKELRINETSNSLGVSLNAQNNRLKFEGDSRPENVQQFFLPILKWLEDYEKLIYFVQDQSKEDVNISIVFEMDYFNSSSAKYILDILLKLRTIGMMPRVKATIFWTIDSMDSDMRESGEEFEGMTDMRFVFKEK